MEYPALARLKVATQTLHPYEDRLLVAGDIVELSREWPRNGHHSYIIYQQKPLNTDSLYTFIQLYNMVCPVGRLEDSDIEILDKTLTLTDTTLLTLPTFAKVNKDLSSLPHPTFMGRDLLKGDIVEILGINYKMSGDLCEYRTNLISSGRKTIYCISITDIDFIDTTNLTVDSRCQCDIMLLTNKGCQCGGT
jgi:hypothetical protein